jgi:hypothetical protein
MSPLHRFPSIAAIAVLLSACPYDGDFPLDPPSAALFEPALLGTWVLADAETAKALELEGFWFTRLDEDEYRFGAIGCQDGGRAWLSRVSGQLFMNMSDNGSTDFNIARIDLQNDRMTAYLLSETGLDSVTSSAQLRAIVERRMVEAGSELYSDTLWLKRSSPGVPSGNAGAAGTDECDNE